MTGIYFLLLGANHGFVVIFVVIERGADYRMVATAQPKRPGNDGRLQVHIAFEHSLNDGFVEDLIGAICNVDHA